MNELQSKIAGILNQEYDVFDVWSVDEDKLVLPSESTLDTKVSEEMINEESINALLGRVASVFGNELIPLLQNMRAAKGIDILVKSDVVLYLKESGEEKWATYANNISDENWEQFAYSINDDGGALANREELYKFVFSRRTYRKNAKQIFAGIVSITDY